MDKNVLHLVLWLIIVLIVDQGDGETTTHRTRSPPTRPATSPPIPSTPEKSVNRLPSFDNSKLSVVFAKTGSLPSSNFSNSSSESHSKPQKVCDGDPCNGGDCRAIYPGTSITEFECICPLFQAGKTCLRTIMFPYISFIMQILSSFGVLGYFVWATERFRTKKINTVSDGVRFVDILQAREDLLAAHDDEMEDSSAEDSAPQPEEDPNRTSVDATEKSYRKKDKNDYSREETTTTTNTTMTDVSTKQGGNTTVADASTKGFASKMTSR